jgi:hypothetical protein
MLEMYDFAVTQVRYIRAAAELIPSFRPDGKDPTAIGLLIPTPDTVRSTYITALTTVGAQRALRRTSIETLHDTNVDFSAQGKSIYRKQPAVLQQLQRLPTDDQTFQQTITRADQVEALWGTLPQVGSPLAPFKVTQGTTSLSLADFTALKLIAVNADAGLPAIDQAFQKAEAALHEKMATLEDFSVAAITQGKSQYDEGTPEREIIDAIPTAPAQQLPEQAVFSLSEFIAPSTIKVEATGTGGTSADYWHKAPGEPDFTKIAQDHIGPLTLTAQPLGEHEFQAEARNSKGTGPRSDSVFVDVA